MAAKLIGDEEIKALARCLVELERLSQDGRRRVLDYLDDRYGGRERLEALARREAGCRALPFSQAPGGQE